MGRKYNIWLQNVECKAENSNTRVKYLKILLMYLTLVNVLTITTKGDILKWLLNLTSLTQIYISFSPSAAHYYNLYDLTSII